MLHMYTWVSKEECRDAGRQAQWTSDLWQCVHASQEYSSIPSVHMNAIVTVICWGMFRFVWIVLLKVYFWCWFFWSKALILHRSVVKCKNISETWTFNDRSLQHIVDLSQPQWGEAKNHDKLQVLLCFGRKFKPLCKGIQRPILKCTFLEKPKTSKKLSVLENSKTFHCHVVLPKEWHRVRDGSPSFLKNLGLIFSALRCRPLDKHSECKSFCHAGPGFSRPTGSLKTAAFSLIVF